MTQQEILEYNKRCAEFLTISEEIENELIAYPEQQYSPLCSYANAAYVTDKEDNPENTVWNYCKFHSDWNWIMEVVEAIEKLSYQVDITGNEVGINSNIMSMRNITTGGTMNSYNEKYYPTIISVTEEEYSKKEAVVQAINQFLIWYNEIQINKH